jgi:hypothetical protein
MSAPWNPATVFARLGRLRNPAIVRVRPARLLDPVGVLARVGMLAVGSLCVATPSPAAQEVGAPDLTISDIFVDPADVVQLRDVDGDGDLDIVCLRDDGIAVYLLNEDGSYPEVPGGHLAWPARDVAWQVEDVDGDGSAEVLLLADGEHLVAHAIDADGKIREPRTLLENPRASLPRGRRLVRFVNDVNGDGRPDLLIPGAGVHHVHFRDEDGDLQPAVDVAFQTEINYQLGDTQRVDGRFGENVRVPRLQTKDVDGDGRLDLVSRTKDRVSFHIARAGFPQQPTWVLDLTREQPEQNALSIDLDNLFGSFGERLTWKLIDVDGVAPNDLLIQESGTFKLYLGGSLGNVDRTPDQVLKSSGTVLHFLVRDVLGDSRPDLQIIRVERISIGQVLRWLVIPGSIDFDVYTYENLGERFGRKPARRSKVALQIPGLIGFVQEFSETQDQLEQSGRAPARKLSLSPDGLENDVVDFRDGELLLFRDVLSVDHEDGAIARLKSFQVDDILEELILRDLDEMRDGATREIDLAEIRNLEISPGNSLRRSAQEHAPVIRVKTPLGDDARIYITDLDRDGTSDIVLSGTVADGQRLVQLILVR